MKLLLSLFAGCVITIMVSGQNKILSGRYTEVYKQYLDAGCPLEKDSIKHFVYFAHDREAIHDHPFLKISRFSGAEVMYPWKELEPEKGNYDFSTIREDYKYLLSHKKKLFVLLQDATFLKENKGIPTWLISNEYDGGIIPQLAENGDTTGWVAKRWNMKVQERFAMLVQALGKEFDGKIEGISLQETSIDVNLQEGPNGTFCHIDSTFTPSGYTESIKVNMLSLRKAFPLSVTMQYANFMPGEWLPRNDKGYLRSIFSYGEEIGVGLGAPDLMVHNKGNLNHTVAMMHEGKYTIPLGIAIEDGNYYGKTGNAIEDEAEKHVNIVPLLHAFARHFLRVKYMFWANQEPYFTEDVIPCFKQK